MVRPILGSFMSPCSPYWSQAALGCDGQFDVLEGDVEGAFGAEEASGSEVVRGGSALPVFVVVAGSVVDPGGVVDEVDVDPVG